MSDFFIEDHKFFENGHRVNRGTFDFEIQDRELQVLTREKPILVPIQLEPHKNMSDLSQYLIDNFPVLNLDPHLNDRNSL